MYAAAAARALTDGHALGVDGAQVAVLKQVHHEVLRGLTQRQQQQQCAGQTGVTKRVMTIALLATRMMLPSSSSLMQNAWLAADSV